MRLTTLLILASVLEAASPAVQIWSASDIKLGDSRTGLDGKTLGSFGNHSTAMWRRTASGQAELHKTKTDILIIEQGEATLLYGGVITGAKSTSPVEVRGASIEGGESKKLGPGDVIRIPPGVPHQFILSKGQTIAYFAVKIAR